MTDRKCLCTGIRLTRLVVEHTDNPALPGALKDAEKIYQHLLEEVDKPENIHLKKQLQKDFDDMRGDLLQDSFTEHPGVLAMERVRDKIHKSPELKHLLVCGNSFEDKKELKQVTGILEMVWTIMAEAGEKSSPYEDVSEAYGPLDDLAKHYECDKL